MKKLFAMILAILMCISIFGCAKTTNTTTSDTTTPNETSGPSDEDIEKALDKIVKDLDSAYSHYSSASALIMSNWDTDPFYFKMFFDENYFEEKYAYAKATGRDKDCSDMWGHYKTADALMESCLTSIKELTPTDNTREYYNAVKEYYTRINALKSLLQTWPQGYNQMSYSQALSTAKSECDTAKSELSFY